MKYRDAKKRAFPASRLHEAMGRETVSLFGTRMGDVAISFAAVIALKRYASPNRSARRGGTVPTLVLSLFVGVWVDRIRRRPIMIASDMPHHPAGHDTLAAIFGALRMTQLYAVMLADAVLRSFLQRRLSRLSAFAGEPRRSRRCEQQADCRAPASPRRQLRPVGWLVQWLTAPFAILIDAISFLASALAIALIRTPEPVPTRRAKGHQRGSRDCGWARLVFSDRRLRALGRQCNRRRTLQQPGSRRSTCSSS